MTMVSVCLSCGKPTEPENDTCDACRLKSFDLSIEADEPTALPILSPAALHGLPGLFVRQLLPYTEAHEAALLADFLASFGTLVGRKPYLYQGQLQRAKLFVCILGMSAKARKGATRRLVKMVFSRMDQEFVNARFVSANVGSGQGIVELVRDIETDKNGDRICGSNEQRLLLYIAELSGLLKVSDKADSILSEIVRQAWDDDIIQLVRRQDPARSTNHHISIVGNAVGSEFFKAISSADMDNGFANRFLFILGYRQNRIPRPVQPPIEMMQSLARMTRAAIDAAHNLDRIEWSDEAGDVWDKEYVRLTADEDGPVGALTGRADTHPTRLAMMYALTDSSPVIQLEHLQAGLALWKYCDESIRYVWRRWGGNSALVKGAEMALSREAETRAARILAAAPQPGDFLGRTEITQLFSRNIKAADIAAIMGELCRRGLFKQDEQGTEGRTALGWRRA